MHLIKNGFSTLRISFDETMFSNKTLGQRIFVLNQLCLHELEQVENPRPMVHTSSPVLCSALGTSFQGSSNNCLEGLGKSPVGKGLGVQASSVTEHTGMAKLSERPKR